MICTIANKINVTPKGVYLPISKLYSILAVGNLLAHNNKSQICYCSQITSQSALTAVFMTSLGVTLILLAMVQGVIILFKIEHNAEISCLFYDRKYCV